MRKLATVTAALALVGATFTFPSADARAGEVGVVILSCAEVIDINVEEEIPAVSPVLAPTVSSIQATMVDVPKQCDPAETFRGRRSVAPVLCSDCIEKLVNDRKCTKGEGAPLSPSMSLGTLVVSRNDTFVSAELLTQYAFVCEVLSE